MYQNFETERFFKFILYVNAAAAAALGSKLWGLVPSIPYISAVSWSVIAVSTTLAILGQTPLFPLICRLPLVWRWIPDIDGLYEVEIASNWPIVQARSDDRQMATKDLLFVKQGTARITSRLFAIQMHLSMLDKYSSSQVVTATLTRDASDPGPILNYVFKAHVPTPEQTDSSEHFGAARIAIPVAPKIAELIGIYWTNRNWHTGLNTAGNIRLVRR